MSQLIISADSHVIEPHDLWTQRVPSKFRELAPRYAPRTRFQHHNGGADPKARIDEMATDGVSMEVLYPSLALGHYGIRDVDLQEACFRVYNDWLIEYCSHVPDRLFGVGIIPCYRIDRAIEEVKYCKNAGMRGVMVWQAPPPELAFTSKHYEKLWALCEELQMPVSLHTLTGIPYTVEREVSTDLAARLDMAVNKKLMYSVNSLMEVIASGVLERFPKLNFVLVETEISWIPYVLYQWDRYFMKGGRSKGELKMPMTDYFKRQIYATFFNDAPASMVFMDGRVDHYMWSNDFPHPNSTWPNSRDVIERDLGKLSPQDKEKLLWKTCAELYQLPLVQPVAA